jgi:hypothetical protein
VVVTGTNFDTASARDRSKRHRHDTSFTITRPPRSRQRALGATTGKIQVTNPHARASSVATFFVPPQITSFSPASGPAEPA